MCRCPLEEICDLCRNLPFHQVLAAQLSTSHTNRDLLMYRVGHTSGNRPNHWGCLILPGLELLLLLPCLSVYLFRL